MTKIYHYIYYRTYSVISRTNKLSPEISASRLMSISIFINVFTTYFFLKKPFDLIGFYIFLSIGIILSFLNLRYFSENRIRAIVLEFKTLKVSKIFNYLVDINYWLFLVLFLISAGADYYIIFCFVGILVILRLMQFFYEM